MPRAPSRQSSLGRSAAISQRVRARAATDSTLVPSRLGVVVALQLVPCREPCAMVFTSSCAPQKSGRSRRRSTRWWKFSRRNPRKLKRRRCWCALALALSVSCIRSLTLTLPLPLPLSLDLSISLSHTLSHSLSHTRTHISILISTHISGHPKSPYRRTSPPRPLCRDLSDHACRPSGSGTASRARPRHVSGRPWR